MGLIIALQNRGFLVAGGRNLRVAETCKEFVNPFDSNQGVMGECPLKSTSQREYSQHAFIMTIRKGV